MITLGILILLWFLIQLLLGGFSPDGFYTTAVLFLLPILLVFLFQYACAFFSRHFYVRILPALFALAYVVCTVGMAADVWDMEWLFGSSGGFLDLRLLVAVCFIIDMAAGIAFGWIVYAVTRKHSGTGKA